MLSLFLMKRGMAFPDGLMMVLRITVLVLIQLLPPASSLNDTHDNYSCVPSCGNIPSISYPFRLKGDPPNCGDKKYELSCDENNHTLLSLHGSKYYVSQINYDDYTIRIIDPNIQEDNYSSIPRSFVNFGNVSRPDWDSYLLYTEYDWINFTRLSKVVIIVNCGKPVTWASSFYLEVTPTNCSNIQNGSGSSSNSYLSQYFKRYIYLIVGYGVKAMDVEESCTIEQMSLTSWPGQINVDRNISCTGLRNVSLYFVLSWYRIYCGSCRHDSCFLDEYNQVYCKPRGFTFATFLQYLSYGLNYVAIAPAYFTVLWTTGRIIPIAYYRDSPFFFVIEVIIGLLFDWRISFSVLGTPFVIAFFIYKWRRRHLSAYNAIEEFLQSQNNLKPISYSYSEIKKMTKGFREKLGEGGYGTVFKGTLRSGYLVAVKMLGQSKTNGQDFINEVATIGRIHHVNVVQLIGYCVHGSKRALVYDFMPKGSLNKYIFSSEESMFLDNEKTYNIALGVARGIEYLHRGCDMQILHFDIKPHNILLDENFIPKVSDFDFGLAKLYK